MDLMHEKKNIDRLLAFRRKRDVLFSNTPIRVLLTCVGFCPVGCAGHTLHTSIFLILLHAAARQSRALSQCPYLSKYKNKPPHRNDKTVDDIVQNIHVARQQRKSLLVTRVRFKRSQSCAILRPLRLRRLTNQHTVGL